MMTAPLPPRDLSMPRGLQAALLVLLGVGAVLTVLVVVRTAVRRNDRVPIFVLLGAIYSRSNPSVILIGALGTIVVSIVLTHALGRFFVDGSGGCGQDEVVGARGVGAAKAVVV
jgi:hypothetical protein